MKGVGGKRRGVTYSVRGKGFVWERRDVIDNARGMCRSGET